MRLWLAFHDDGIYWPDEIYQSLEPAHRVVFGFGTLPWEFAEGARNWTLPGLIAGFFKIADVLHLPRPGGCLALTRIALCVTGVAAIYFTYRLSRRAGASQPAAMAGAALLALGAVPIYFAPRAPGETVSMLPVAAGFALALTRGDRKWRLLGVALLAIAVFLRLQNAIFCVTLLIALLVSRRYREGLEARYCWPLPEWRTGRSTCSPGVTGSTPRASIFSSTCAAKPAPGGCRHSPTTPNTWPRSPGYGESH